MWGNEFLCHEIPYPSAPLAKNPDSARNSWRSTQEPIGSRTAKNADPVALIFCVLSSLFVNVSTYIFATVQLNTPKRPRKKSTDLRDLTNFNATNFEWVAKHWLSYDHSLKSTEDTTSSVSDNQLAMLSLNAPTFYRHMYSNLLSFTKKRKWAEVAVR